ncbi:MAG: GAF domain-containing protein [Paludibacteraceae bacterium]|nr:GAF domain-containing protein [Paludibacteraceae bacterium]
METKRETYEALMLQIEALVSGETDLIANMANVAAVLHEAFGFWWTGFYRVTGKGLQVTGEGLQVTGEGLQVTDEGLQVTDEGLQVTDEGLQVTGKGLQVTGKGLQELVLGPFQGPMACTRIPYGKGVCGTAWQRGETVIVPDVHAFAGHIACSSESNSEIVVPIWQDGKVIAVLDIDSKDYNTFDETDKIYLEQIAKIISKTK